jgi:hypothetical protein
MTRPLNYTTKIAAAKTAGECLQLLAEAGAHAVSVTYADREPSGLAFRLDTAGGRKDFALPVDQVAMQAVLRKALQIDRPHVGAAELDRMFTLGHARNVAWRVVRDWLAAQLALIAAQMATLDQVMLPYLEVAPGETLFARYLAMDGQLAIEGGGK